MPAFWKRIADGMRKTRAVFTDNLQEVFRRGGRLDEDFFEELEEVLLTADVGVETATALVEDLRQRARRVGVEDVSAAHELMQDVLRDRLARGRSADGPPDGLSEGPAHGPAAAPVDGAADPAPPTRVGDSEQRPRVILVAGVNGVGKTTSIGKLAYRYTQAGRKTLVVASDTFRAAALEQLAVWAERAGADLVRSQHGADAAAVAYDGVRAAIAREAEVVIVDTAGRLQTNKNLMAELGKIQRVLGKALPGAPHEVLLVLDATVGQNALSQVTSFTDVISVTGIVLAKLDGSARGGVILAIADQLGVPVRYVGLGEQLEDLADFDPDGFARALLAPIGATE